MALAKPARARTAAWLTAALLLFGAGAAGCGDDGGGTDEPSPTRSVTPTKTASPTGDEPSDPEAAEEEIEENWETFFDPATSRDEKAELLQDGSRLKPLLEAFSGDQRGEQVKAEVTEVTFTSATSADVTYALTLKGATVLPDASGVSVLQDGEWKVSHKTLCGLVELSEDAPQAPGC
ncbi:hypothetical protein LRS74_26965 [Streptomyces sp. LX-29]|uniref:hypothetical protein n=1 Tax=Streptomyces sp. LX-29 TaxID=2900152 RepID=UPI00240E6B94|nr:hypothetical protein [Streptomyces sp. LX-29]WFB10272.1 hypothetical protein LRS74_26965 [Streptomyces sp. LX-29]